MNENTRIVRPNLTIAFLLPALLCFRFSTCLVFPDGLPDGTETHAPPWQEVTTEAWDRTTLGSHGLTALNLPGLNWKHAETPHFVIHYEQAIFARKTARMAEFFYSYIKADFEETPDHTKGRSHVFIFRDDQAWRAFKASRPDVESWTYSMVEGPIMYLQQADSPAASGDVLAHEMTHLVLNRILPGQCPLWLNEGLAEFYGTFAYAAFKGIKKSRGTQFKRLDHPYPLDSLFTATDYPSSPEQVRAFYETARYLVGFLLLKGDPKSFRPFIESLSSGEEISAALSAYYHYPTLADMEKSFSAFSK
ncbi:MAG: hypothetical protein V2A34_11830 [Lentisphaerota bacterium]